jgi:hypothetical protein
MLNPTFKRLSMGALLLLPIAAAAGNPVPAASPPNLYELAGKTLRITYSTTGFDGRPHFTYQDANRTRNFAGNQIRTVPTELGTLVSVTLSMTVDAGSTSFSILVPNVNLGAALEAPIRTDGIITRHKFSVIPSFNEGQTDNYAFYALAGKAKLVAF